MYRMFSVTRKIINQNQATRFFANQIPINPNHLPVVNEKLNRINDAMTCDKPRDYEEAMLRAFGFLRSHEQCLEPALQSIEIALEYNPNSLCAAILESLLCNELRLTERGEDCVQRLRNNTPTYLEEIFKIESSLAEAIKLTPAAEPEPTKQNVQAHKVPAPSEVKNRPFLLEKLPCSSEDYSNSYRMPAYK